VHLENIGYGDSDIALANEASLLWTIRFGGTAELRKAASIARPEMFQDSVARFVYERMLERMHQGETVSGYYLDKALVDNLRKDRDATCRFLSVFTNERLNNPVRASGYAHDIAERHNRTKVKHVAGRFRKDADELAPCEAIGTTSRRLEALAGQIESDEGASLQEAIANAVTRTETEDSIATGIGTLDTLAGGMVPGRVITIAARSGEGKTALAMQCAVEAARQGTRVAYYSFEMPAHELGLRVACSEARIDSSLVRTGYIASEAQSKLDEAIAELGQLPLTIIDRPSNVDEIATKTRILHSESPIGLVVVDYLGIVPIQSQYQRSTRAEQIGSITKALKQLAMSLDITVMQLSQVNREGSKEQLLKLNHLRDSSDVLNDSDQVWFIQRGVDATGGPSGNPNDAGIEVAKNRHGGTGMAQVQWVPQHVRFDNGLHDFSY